jgi:hypothetical protein
MLPLSRRAILAAPALSLSGAERGPVRCWDPQPGARIQEPDSRALHIGGGDFSLAAWVNAEDEGGDILSKFDQASRRGFNFSVVTNTGVNCAQSNWRHIHFGIDNGQVSQPWTDCGRPGNAVLVFALAVHQGNLYAATCSPGAGDSGRVLRWEGGTRWIDCGGPDRSNSVAALAAWEGALYAGTARYNLGGSSLAASANQTPGGRVLRYEGGARWTDCGNPGGIAAIHGMVVFRGRLYASSFYETAGVYRYEGAREWRFCGNAAGKRINTLTVHDGHLYGTSYDVGQIFRYDGGQDWVSVGVLPGATQGYGFATYEGKLHVSTWPRGSVFRFDRDNHWTDCGRLGGELEGMGMAVYNGKLYAGTLPLAAVYRYEGERTWTNTGRVDLTPDVKYRRAWTMALYRGKLFCGTLPSGRVWSFEAGWNVTSDFALGRGWHHLAAVRDGGRLELYVDGRLTARSGPFRAKDFDLGTNSPLRVGWGPRRPFDGSLRDVRLYRRALKDGEIRALAADALG